MRRYMALLGAGLLLGSACASPCDELRDLACEAAGAASDECQHVREMAAQASSEDKRACTIALELVRSLEQAR